MIAQEEIDFFSKIFQRNLYFAAKKLLPVIEKYKENYPHANLDIFLEKPLSSPECKGGADEINYFCSFYAHISQVNEEDSKAFKYIIENLKIEFAAFCCKNNILDAEEIKKNQEPFRYFKSTANYIDIVLNHVGINFLDDVISLAKEGREILNLPRVSDDMAIKFRADMKAAMLPLKDLVAQINTESYEALISNDIMDFSGNQILYVFRAFAQQTDKEMIPLRKAMVDVIKDFVTTYGIVREDIDIPKIRLAQRKIAQLELKKIAGEPFFPIKYSMILANIAAMKSQGYDFTDEIYGKEIPRAR